MSLHRLTSVTVGVPNLDASRQFYRDFGLVEGDPGRFSSRSELGVTTLTTSGVPRRRCRGPASRPRRPNP